MLNRTTFCSIVIVLFHMVGLYGFLMPSLENLFISLVPFHLLLMLILLIVSGHDSSLEIITLALVVSLSGFLIEVIGVNTGFIFGSYSYRTALGIKLWDTPLMIGVNWLILVYCTGVFLEQFKLKSRFVFSALGAMILLGLDLLIEPVAMRFDYWTWSGGNIPLQNYIGWYIVSFLLFWYFSGMDFKKENKAAIVLLFAQLSFFVVLNIWAL